MWHVSSGLLMNIYVTYLD